MFAFPALSTELFGTTAITITEQSRSYKKIINDYSAITVAIN